MTKMIEDRTTQSRTKKIKGLVTGDFSPIGGLRTGLHFFCWDVCHNEDRENSVVTKVNTLMEQNHVTAEAALHQLQEERPLLLKEPSLGVWPPDVLFAYTEEVAKKTGKEDLFEAQETARKEHPKLAQLSDLCEQSPWLFEGACSAVGSMIGSPAYPGDGLIIETILRCADRIIQQKADKERKEIEEWYDYEEAQGHVTVRSAMAEVKKHFPGFQLFWDNASKARDPVQFKAALTRLEVLLALPPDEVTEEIVQEIGRNSIIVINEVNRIVKS